MQNGDESFQDGNGEDIEVRLLEFAVRVGKAVDALPNTRLGRHIAGQLVRSGTSPAPNYAEGCAAESKKDFIHKLAIVLKELRESSVWIRLIVKSELIPEQRLELLLDESNQLCKIIAKSPRDSQIEESLLTNNSSPLSILIFPLSIFH